MTSYSRTPLTSGQIRTAVGGRRRRRIGSAGHAHGAGLVLSAWAVSAASGQLFTPGNLVVARAGEWFGNGASAGDVQLVEFTTLGALTGASVALPTTPIGANHMCTVRFGDSSEGQLTLSGDGNYLVMAGYDAAPGTANVSSTTVDRVVARVSSAGVVDTTTHLSGVFSANHIRSACSLNGSGFWLSGGSQGVMYAALGATSGTLIGTPGPADTRAVNIYASDLYVSSAAAGYLGVSRIIGTPVVAAAVTNLVGMPTLPGTSVPYDFYFASAATLYIADQSGLQKWTFTAGSWSLQYTLATGLGEGRGLRGLTGTVDGAGNAVLYATTDEILLNDLVTVTDAGPGSPFTVLATATGTTAFRGVDFAPNGPIPVNGACCVGGVCSSQSPTACANASGTFFGSGSLCANINCPGTCYPNCDGSTIVPILNANDFQCFLNKFAAGAPYADCDGNGLLNVNDFMCFLNKYAAGCL